MTGNVFAYTAPTALRVVWLESGGTDQTTTCHTYGDYITNVTFAGINNTTPGSGSNAWHTDFGRSPQIAAGEVTLGQSYPISITITGSDLSYDFLGVYIDWDQNNVNGTSSAPFTLDANENPLVWYGATGSGSKTFTGTITVPAGAPVGLIYMRVMLDGDSGGVNGGDYTSGVGFGEFEDYVLNVSGGVNNAPTDVSLSASAVNENVSTNYTVGTLSTTDPDVGNTFTYSLVSGTGDTDNASFNISGSSLRITNSPDYETKSSYSVRVRTTDQGALYYEKAYTITINDLNEAPTDISLSASSINENVAGNSAIGNLNTTDQDAGNSFTYTLVAGTGSTDNASFNISGSSLRITSSPDFETKSSYSVRVRTTDQGSLTFEKAFTITISNVNETPTDISLSASSINENVVANSTVGTLSSTDPDAGNTFTYTLVVGTGDTDNASFNISGSSLRITNSPDFETKSSFSVRVRTTDQGSLTYEEAFTVTINDLNETPTNISLSASSINENVIANSTIGTLSSTDLDAANTFTYTLVAGTGSTDNASFNISGSSIRITGSPDFETKSSYSVRVRTTDQGTLFYEKAFTITINDLNEAPTDISLSASSINENVVANSTVGTLSSTDQDAINTFTYTLVAGTGSTDNASFNISGSSLRITNSPDFETKSSYSVRVRTTDQGSLTYEKAFTITISNVNEIPTDISLSASSINENVVANSTIGTLSSTDPDAGNTFTYTLVVGTGSTDNASFNISGSSLRITSSPDFETKNSFSVRVRSTDQGSLWFEKVFIVTINDLNEAPSDITLSASSINENVVANSTIGTLSSTDQDVANTFTYTLVVGTGSTDNASFNISGSSLRITNSPDFETKGSYSVRVRTTDQGGVLYYEKAFTITINNVNEIPTDIALSATSIDENVVANSTVSTLSTTDPDAGNTFTYTFVVGTGDTDNSSFNISGSSLRITNSPDFEVKNSYSIRIRTTDQGSLNFEKTFTITINNVNETPTDITLSANSIDENVASNSTVGSLSTTDVDAGNTFTYTLVVGAGDTDNASFNISGSSLQITNSPDYEAKSSYSVRIQTTDQGSLTYEKTFTITINDLNEAPTDISLSVNSIDENAAANSIIGTLSSTDQDAGNTFTYTLVAGAGSSDNSSFSISGNELHIISSPDYETKSSYFVRFRSTDQGSLYFEKSYAIIIHDVNESPVVTASQSFSIDENSIVGTVVGIVSATDPDAGDTFSNWTITSNVNPDGDGTDAFAIDALTGQITVLDADDLDIETNTSSTIKVTVSDGTNTSAEEDITINITDVNDVTPVITASQVLYVTEQSPNGTTVGTVVATDGDVTATTFQNWTITAGNDGGYFTIDSSTGVITVADNTGLNSSVNPSFTLTLTVSDGVNTSLAQTVSIIVSAVNDENPVVTPNQSFAIDENSANATVVGTVLATDPDYGTNFQNWTITAGNTDNAFAINLSNGEITVNTSSVLDYETVTSLSLTVQVSDGLHTASGVVTVNLNNLNDNAPTINGGTFALDENSSNGTSVCTISANDPDGILNALTFSLINTKVSSPFAVDLNTGVVSVNNSTLLDYETIQSYSVTIRVSDGTHSSDGVFTINLNNLNDNSPVVIDATFAIDENSANSTAVGTVAATDADGVLNSLTYSITAGNTNDAFAIDAATGAITVNHFEELNFEATPTFTLTISVFDGSNSTNGTITINLNDVIETGIDDNKEFSYKIYPNPAVDKVNIYFNNPTSESYTVEIVRIDGVRFYQSCEKNLSGIKTIDLKGITSGVYFIRVYNQKFMCTDKLIVE